MGQGVTLPGENKLSSIARKFWLKARRTLNNTLKCVWHVNRSPFLAVLDVKFRTKFLFRVCGVVGGGLF